MTAKFQSVLERKPYPLKLWALFSLSLGWFLVPPLAWGGDIPSEEFFENYIAEKVETYQKYRDHGIDPFLSMTLANNSAFRCITSGGREVDFEGYLEIYQYTFDRFVYEGITPVGVDIDQTNEDQIVVTYTMRMQGKSRAGSRYDVLRENRYTFTRIKAGDQEKLQELNPQNLDKYFEPNEDMWIVTKIEYGF